VLRLGSICAVIVSLYCADALACSCAITPLQHVVPVDGSTDVPTNVVFLLGVTVRRQTVELRQSSGAIVETFKANPATARVKPTNSLAPNTPYSLYFVPGPDEDGEPRRVSTFTTGVAADTTPPSLDDFDFTWSFTPGPPGCEDKLFKTIFALAPKGATDEATPANQLSFDAFVADTASTIDFTQASVVIDQPASIREAPCDTNLGGITAALDLRFRSLRSTGQGIGPLPLRSRS
jgi:hypothetical protein